MSRALRGVVFLAAAGVVALLQPLPVTMADATKEFPLCVQACNDARDMCRDQCLVDCAALFPGDPVGEQACVETCWDVCIFQSQDCKKDCQAARDGGSPPEP